MFEIIYGKNVIREAMEHKRVFQKLYILKDNIEMIELAKKHQLLYEITTKDWMNSKAKGQHQGVLAYVSPYQTKELEDVLSNIEKPLPILVALDGLEDPHNLGAILRTADAVGVDAIILPKHRSVRLNQTVAKVSSGAIEYVPVVEVVNLVTTLNKLKKIGYWVIGAERSNNSTPHTAIKYDMPIVLVIGSEGKGISRLVLENCDYLVEIPMHGHVNSLNASVSTAVLLYEIIRGR